MELKGRTGHGPWTKKPHRISLSGVWNDQNGTRPVSILRGKKRVGLGEVRGLEVTDGQGYDGFWREKKS